MSGRDQSPFLDALRDRVLVFDGAMGTSLQFEDPSVEDFGGKALEGWMDGLVLHAPQMVERIHRSFLDAGCDVLETSTFQATRPRLEEWGQSEVTQELNISAARLARRVADEYEAHDGRRRFVAGSMGPTGFLPASSDPSMSRLGFRDLVPVFLEQASALIEGGADLLIIETQQDILETKAAVFGARTAAAGARRPVALMTTVSLDVTGRMLLGTDAAAVLAILESLHVDVIGFNCSTGPEHMREPIRYITSHTSLPVACIPNAGLPLNVDGRAHYPLEPVPMATELASFVREYGVNVVGGCCGSTPEHIRELVERVRATVRGARTAPDLEPRLASAMHAIDLRQQPAPLLIGERVNSQGSRAIKRLLLADDYDGILGVARTQVEGGAHALDLCVALTERSDEAEQMGTVVKTLQMSIDAPLVIDSTDADVIKAALEVYPGRGIVNSVNLENGRVRCDAVLPLVRDHGACVIALTIDEEGMARTAGRKLEIARRIRDLARDEFELQPHQLIFDALTFTLATGEAEWIDSAHETIDGIRAIKRELPGVLTVLGVSNVSFGLAPRTRPILNSVFLHHCIEAGLDAAIINPTHVVPYGEIEPEARRLAEELVFNSTPDALTRFIAHFDDGASSGAGLPETADPYEGMSTVERIHAQILHRRKDGIEEQIDIALRDQAAVSVLNTVLLPAMKDVGDRFGSGELILPFVLQSAEVMKRAVAHLEQFLEKREGYTKGKVVLATVYGDVHDIGKNLVKTILSNNGYTVFDLGKQVPLNTIIDKALEVDADAIGLSALLVSTSKQMPACVKELDERGLTYPLIIGGAAINRGFGRRILYLDQERAYEPGVFYCKDAFEGLETIDQLLDPDRHDALLSRVVEEARVHRIREHEKLERRNAAASGAAALPARSSVRRDAPIPQVPFWGARVLRDIPIWDVYPHIDRNSLYKMSWQFRGVRDAAKWDELLKTELEPRLQRSMEEAVRDGWLDLQAVYGYWPALADGDTVIVYDPGDIDAELGRFTFPRQNEQHRLCLADYVRPAEDAADGERDVIALQIVTTGPRASELSNQLQVDGSYDDMLRIHGFATQMAEATAEYVHTRIRRELRLVEDQGRRYSWGYPSCPDLEDHETLMKIVPASEIGVTLTEGYQFVPEQSTGAIVMHHPEARYFAVYGGANVEEDAPGAPEPVLTTAGV
jgi:5-methyltetrahydrofolate--homocysteine methyltransferase